MMRKQNIRENSLDLHEKKEICKTPSKKNHQEKKTCAQFFGKN